MLHKYEIEALERNNSQEIVDMFGYPLAICPNGFRCVQDAEWGHPCDRDELGNYECLRDFEKFGTFRKVENS